jgi:hypothetical protein
MVCDNTPDEHNAKPDGDGLSKEDLALLHQIRRIALASESELRQMRSSPALPDATAAEMTQRLTAIKALAGGLLGG